MHLAPISSNYFRILFWKITRHALTIKRLWPKLAKAVKITFVHVVLCFWNYYRHSQSKHCSLIDNQSITVTGGRSVWLGVSNWYRDWMRSPVWSASCISGDQYINLSKQIRPWNTPFTLLGVEQPPNIFRDVGLYVLFYNEWMMYRKPQPNSRQNHASCKPPVSPESHKLWTYHLSWSSRIKHSHFRGAVLPHQ